MYGALALFLGLVFLAAWTGSRFRPGDWYFRLAKPTWTPPPWVFAPAWTLLYILMAVAAWLVWREQQLAAAVPLAVFVLQLALNGLWSFCFFGRRRPGLALADLLALWLAIVATVLLFWAVRPLAGALLLPYIAWVTFAGALNGAVWRMNR